MPEKRIDEGILTSLFWVSVKTLFAVFSEKLPLFTALLKYFLYALPSLRSVHLGKSTLQQRFFFFSFLFFFFFFFLVSFKHLYHAEQQAPSGPWSVIIIALMTICLLAAGNIAFILAEGNITGQSQYYPHTTATIVLLYGVPILTNSRVCRMLPCTWHALCLPKFSRTEY